jgi:rhamnose utilization protein RhaD (predicted bifunctional aldolase and dehydrogenase)
MIPLFQLPAPTQPTLRAMPEFTPMESLLWLAHEVGREDRHLAILTEGSVSVKVDDRHFLTKAAGTQLSRLRDIDAALCETEPCAKLVDEPFRSGTLQQSLQHILADPGSPAPTLDAPLHAYLLSQKNVGAVAHAHPEAVLQILCSPAAQRFADHRMFPNEIEFCGAQSVYVPYIDTGATLSREIRSKVALSNRRSQDRMPRLILIQNEGVIALGPTPAAVLETLMMAEKAARVFVGASRLGGVLFLPTQHVIRAEVRPDPAKSATTTPVNIRL